MLHEIGEVGYELKSLLLLQSSLSALHMMFPMSQAQQDPLPRVVLVELRTMLISSTFSNVGLKYFPVLQGGQEPRGWGHCQYPLMKSLAQHLSCHHDCH